MAKGGAAEVSPARKGGELTARSAAPFAVPFPRSFRVAVLTASPDRPRQPLSRLRQVTNLPGRQAGHKPQVTNHVNSNRHTSRLQSAVTSSKQTAGTHSNRHFLIDSARSFPSAANLPRRQAGHDSQTTVHALCPKTTHSLAAICHAHESDIMSLQSGPALSLGNLWRNREWFS